MARKLAKTSPSNIPPEIIEIILLKLLSVKSLLRFKAVSKSWNTLISDLVFNQTHLHSLKTSPDNLFLSRYKDNANGGFPMVKFEGGKVDPGVIFVKNIPNGYYNAILCECNGVLLLTTYKYDKYTLWNPSTHETFRINQGEFGERYILDYGICYDQITADFKVVFVSLTKYEIYSCNKNSWTKKDFGTEYYNIGGPGSGIFLDGATYWIFGEGSHTSGIQLVYFDPRTDEMKRLQNPEQLSDEDKFQLIRLDTFRGSLCLYCYNNQDKSVEIWIKDNSTNWKEFITVGVFKPPYTWTPLCFVENKVVVQEERNKFVCYSPNENTVEECFVEIDVNGGRYIPYRNTLYFPIGLKMKMKTDKA